MPIITYDPGSNRIQMTCECGVTTYKQAWNRHIKTKRHIKIMSKLNDEARILREKERESRVQMRCNSNERVDVATPSK